MDAVGKAHLGLTPSESAGSSVPTPSNTAIHDALFACMPAFDPAARGSRETAEVVAVLYSKTLEVRQQTADKSDQKAKMREWTKANLPVHLRPLPDDLKKTVVANLHTLAKSNAMECIAGRTR
ncbi:hypothetical protein [Rhizobium subbaraonis]|uniref:hypothetical protein n=1 Tax=Rhizobium subbaraonis TaxID=908946 RepID=UPI0011421211|nr:hypothetical protein [Rhizobium subbaraonis]